MLYTEILNNNKDFLNLYKKGKFISGRYSVIYIRPNGRSYNRLGITAGKKTGNAVKRNRAKRVIRQVYCETEILMPIGIDIVIVARSPICEIKSQEYRSYMEDHAIPDICRITKKLSEKGCYK